MWVSFSMCVVLETLKWSVLGNCIFLRQYILNKSIVIIINVVVVVVIHIEDI